MHLWPFSKSKFNLKSDRVNLVAPASPIECLLYLPNAQTIQYKLGPERLTRLGNSNVLRLPVLCKITKKFHSLLFSNYHCIRKVKYCFLSWFIFSGKVGLRPDSTEDQLLYRGLAQVPNITRKINKIWALKKNGFWKKLDFLACVSMDHGFLKNLYIREKSFII